MMLKRCFSVLIAASMALLLGLNLLAHAQQAVSPKQAEIKKNLDLSNVWENQKITIHTYEEDIQTTLRALARLVGLSITFGEGITDTVSLDLENFPAKKAFDMIIDEYGLDYKQDVDSIHVFKRGVVQEVLIQLENIETEEAKRAIERFGFMKKEVKIVFDEPTNTIFLAGPPRDIGNIQNLLNVLESSKQKALETEPEIRYFTLRYAKVGDTTIKIGDQDITVKGLETVLTDILDLTKIGEEIRGAKHAKGEKPPAEEAVTSAQEEQVRIVKKMIGTEAGTITSDPRTNRIIIRDYPEKLDEYANIIEQFDQPTKMVKIDVTIVAATKDFAREVGIGITGTKQTSVDNTYTGSSSVPSRDAFFTPSPLTLIPLPEAIAGSPIQSYGLAGTFLYEGAKSTLSATLVAAEAKGVSKIINQSSIVTMDNMEAIVDAKETITYKLQTGGDNPTVEDRSIDAGIVLNTTPHIIETEDKGTLIELVLTAERSSFLAARTDDIPHEAITTLTTQAVIGDKKTLPVGGFFENTYSSGETGVPCLMNIPIAGNLLKVASTRNPKNNLLFILTPTVISMDKIPYEGPELKQKIEKYQKELKKIDGDRQEKYIEKYQD